VELCPKADFRASKVFLNAVHATIIVTGNGICVGRRVIVNCASHFSVLDLCLCLLPLQAHAG
jgi:hypothetical protein